MSWARASYHRTPWMVGFLLLAACQGRGSDDDRLGDAPPTGEASRAADSAGVAFIVYDAGETLGLLPVAPRLRSMGLGVRWIPLTPWAAELLSANGEPFLPLPADASEMPHVQDREWVPDTGYWEGALVRDPPGLVVSGMVSAAQGKIASRLGEGRIPTRGFYDGFQPPAPSGISARMAPRFDAIWVPTARVREGFRALGQEAVLAGQPSLEAWRRASEEADAAEVRDRLGAREEERILAFAGQYGPGYEEVLTSFLRAIRETLDTDPTLLLVLSPHPRTRGAVESAALAQADLPRAILSGRETSTMELAAVSEVVLTWTSTVAVQAAFLGKPVIYYSPPEDFDAHLVEEGVAALADSGSLGRLVQAALGDPGDPESKRSHLVSAGYVVDADRVVAELIRGAMGG